MDLLSHPDGRRREHHATARTHEKLVAERHTEAAQRATHRGRREVSALGRLRDAPFLQEGVESVQQVQIEVCRHKQEDFTKIALESKRVACDLSFMTTIAKPITHTFFMLVKTTNVWLALPPKARFQFLSAEIEPLLKQHPAVKMRFFDSEAFTGRYSDVVMWETKEIGDYQAIVEGLRETAFWGAYFEVLEIVPAIENAYAEHYEVAPMGG